VIAELSKLKKDTLFQNWKENHSPAFLSHFFCTTTASLELQGVWEIGFYDPKANKITVFKSCGDSFEIKPEEEVFKKEEDKVEELDCEKVKVDFEKAKDLCLKKFPELFPKEILGDGFVVLQKLNGKNLWNVSNISKTVKFLNIQVNAVSGEIIFHQTIDMIDHGTKK